MDWLWMGCTLTMHWHLLKQNKLLCAIMTWIFKKILTLEWRTVNRITRHGGQLSLAWLAAQYWDERHFQRATVQTQNTENQCPETSNQTQNREKHYPKKRNSEIYVLRHRIKQKIEVRRAMPERNHFFLQEMFPYWQRQIFSEMYWVISFSAMC